jgi:hypothetical protein
MNNKLQEKHKELEVELSEQFSEISDKAKEVGKQALVIAGGVFVAYQLVKFMTSSKKKKKKSSGKVYQQLAATSMDESGTPRIIIKEAPDNHNSSFLSEMKAEFGAMLMGLAKAKIYEVLENLNKNKQNSDEENEHS